jgi:hypothetical protein
MDLSNRINPSESEDDFGSHYYYPLYNVLCIYGKYSAINNRIYFMVERNNRTQSFLSFYRKDETIINETLFPLLEMDTFEVFVFLIEDKKLNIQLSNIYELYNKTKYALINGVRSNVSFREYIQIVLKKEFLKNNKNELILFWSNVWLLYIFDEYQNFFLNIVVPKYLEKGILKNPKKLPIKIKYK